MALELTCPAHVSFLVARLFLFFLKTPFILVIFLIRLQREKKIIKETAQFNSSHVRPLGYPTVVKETQNKKEWKKNQTDQFYFIFCLCGDSDDVKNY